MLEAERESCKLFRENGIRLYNKSEKGELEEVLEVLDKNYAVKELNRLGNSKLC